MTEPSWLVKDFHALYRAAKALVDPAVPDAGTASRDFQDLQFQLRRLRTAFEVCEFERKGQGIPQRLRMTPAESKALDALHRWLHSPLGEDALIEEAQDYHDQVEAEGGAADCERLTEEERLAWAQLRREGVCRVCGCTDNDCMQCVEKTGEPCHWVEPDLCSACVAVSP